MYCFQVMSKRKFYVTLNGLRDDPLSMYRSLNMLWLKVECQHRGKGENQSLSFLKKA